MRTNIEIDQELISAIIRMTEAKTQKQAIEDALKRYSRHMAQLALLELKGKVKWEGDLDEMRTSKYL